METLQGALAKRAALLTSFGERGMELSNKKAEACKN